MTIVQNYHFLLLNGSQQPKWENWNHWSSFYAHTSVSLKFLAKTSSGTLISKFSSHFLNSQNPQKWRTLKNASLTKQPINQMYNTLKVFYIWLIDWLVVHFWLVICLLSNWLLIGWINCWFVVIYLVGSVWLKCLFNYFTTWLYTKFY